MLHCNIAGANYMAGTRRPLVSKQLTISAAVSVIAMTAFALFAAHAGQPVQSGSAPNQVAALKATLPDS
jgi:hypothetical protein